MLDDTILCAVVSEMEGSESISSGAQYVILHSKIRCRKTKICGLAQEIGFGS
jgi:hypothetical protein